MPQVELNEADLFDIEPQVSEIPNCEPIPYKDRNGLSATIRFDELSSAALSGADLCGASLAGADMSGIELVGARLTGAELREADLRSADMSDANLANANLHHANVSGADISRADLSEADLSGADLSVSRLASANLCGADLRGADLSRSNISGANLSRANLAGANLTGVTLGSLTIWTSVKGLHQAVGLETIRHAGPSSLDAETLRRSFAHLPEAFLKGVGYTEREIAAMRDLYDGRSRYRTAFVSFARADQAFVEKLCDDLAEAGITAYKDDRDLRDDGYWLLHVEEDARGCGPTIMVCSETTWKRPVVVKEVLSAADTALGRFIPIAIDGYLHRPEIVSFACDEGKGSGWPENWLPRLRAVPVADFSAWRSNEDYRRSLDALIDRLFAAND